MRYVRHEQPPDPDWPARAAAVLLQLENAQDDAARAAIIDSEAALYGELRTWLLNKSHGKCWFSEAKELFSHLHVEHYRPKKKARHEDGPPCPGYWWLAFDWKNLRICGSVGNTKKGTFFPLRTGCPRATADARLIDDEEPTLLDPANPQDPALIDFDEEGTIRPSPAAVSDWDQERVRVSAKRYKLDYAPLEQERKRVWTECRFKLDECDVALANYNQHNSPAGRTRAKDLMAELLRVCSADSPLSRVARSCLMTSGKPWAAKLVESV